MDPIYIALMLIANMTVGSWENRKCWDVPPCHEYKIVLGLLLIGFAINIYSVIQPQDDFFRGCHVITVALSVFNCVTYARRYHRIYHSPTNGL